jgi:hypothetical protein
MKTSKFTALQIAFALQQAETGNMDQPLLSLGIKYRSGQFPTAWPSTAVSRAMSTEDGGPF